LKNPVNKPTSYELVLKKINEPNLIQTLVLYFFQNDFSISSLLRRVMSRVTLIFLM
jgi:hypothetical protein